MALIFLLCKLVQYFSFQFNSCASTKRHIWVQREYLSSALH
jgi:hypothetical protein